MFSKYQITETLLVLEWHSQNIEAKVKPSLVSKEEQNVLLDTFAVHPYVEMPSLKAKLIKYMTSFQCRFLFSFWIV